jgi:hypothetical protein
LAAGVDIGNFLIFIKQTSGSLQTHRTSDLVAGHFIVFICIAGFGTSVYQASENVVSRQGINVPDSPCRQAMVMAGKKTR